MGDWGTSEYFPFKKVYDTSYKPDGAEKVAKQVVDQSWPQLAAILESAANAVGVAPQQISIFRQYERPKNPSYWPAKYASSIGEKFGVTLSGADIDVKDLLIENAKAALRESVIEGVADALPGSGAATGAIRVGVSLIEDKNYLSTDEGRMNAGFTIASTVPVINVVSNVVQVAMDISKSKNMLKSTDGQIKAGIAVAAVIPGLQPVAAIGALTMTVKGIVDAKRAVEEAKKAAKRAAEYTKMMQSYIAVVVPEARALAEAMAVRGVTMLGKPSSAFSSKLKAHYHELVYARIRQINEGIEREKAAWYVKYGQSVLIKKVTGGVRFSKRKLTFGRFDNMRIFLQFARDMRKLKQALEMRISIKGTQWKEASEVSAETLLTANQMLAKDPSMPIQSAMNIASGIARKSKQPLGTSVGQAVANVAAKKVGEVKRNDSIASLGVMGLVAALKFGIFKR